MHTKQRAKIRAKAAIHFKKSDALGFAIQKARGLGCLEGKERKAFFDIDTRQPNPGQEPCLQLGDVELLHQRSHAAQHRDNGFRCQSSKALHQAQPASESRGAAKPARSNGGRLTKMSGRRPPRFDRYSGQGIGHIYRGFRADFKGNNDACAGIALTHSVAVPCAL